MPGKHPPGLVEMVALQVAQGVSTTTIAKKHPITARTIQRWMKRPAFIARVEQFRSQMVDEAIGILAAGAAIGATRLRMLVAKSQNEQIQLSAARALLSDLLAVQSHASIQRELNEIKVRLAKQEERRARHS